MPENECIVVYCSCPEGDFAAQLATTLVTESLAACVNRLPGLISNYRWDGKVQEDRETLLVIKSTRARLPGLVARIRALHPYELPEIVAVPVLGGHDGYLDWLRASVAHDSTA